MCKKFSIIIFLISIMTAIPVCAQSDISVYVNGNKVEADNKPIIADGTTLIPMRAIGEAMGCAIDWDIDLKIVSIMYSDMIVSMQIGNSKFSKIKRNNEKNIITLNCEKPPRIINGVTYIPLRAMAEALEAQVEWNSADKAVIIKSEINNDSSTFYKLEGNTLTILGSGNYDSEKNFEEGGSPWYDRREEIEHVIIEPGVTRIGDKAFYDLENISTVQIPGTVTSIGNSAFSNCKNLKEIELPSSLIEIDSYAFSCCYSLTSIKIPESVTIMSLFNYKELDKDDIGWDLSTRVFSPFAGCSNLMTVYCKKGSIADDSAWYSDNTQIKYY